MILEVQRTGGRKKEKGARCRSELSGVVVSGSESGAHLNDAAGRKQTPSEMLVYL
jgi:hypothetical protein